MLQQKLKWEVTTITTVGGRSHSKVTTTPGESRSAQVDEKKIRAWDEYFFKGDGTNIKWGNITTADTEQGGAIET